MAAMAQHLKIRRVLIPLVSIYVMDAETRLRAVVTAAVALTRFPHETRSRRR
jgi:hypothetical protein